MRFNPYFGSNNYRQNKLAKIGIKSCRFALECVSFVHAWMSVTSYPARIVFAWTPTVASVACSVRSQQFYNWTAS